MVANGGSERGQTVVDKGSGGGKWWQQTVADGVGGRWQIVVDGVAIDGSRWRLAVAIDSNQRQLVADNSGRRWWMVDKVNGEIINWYEVRKKVVRRYKIKGEKFG